MSTQVLLPKFMTHRVELYSSERYVMNLANNTYVLTQANT